MLKNLLIEKLKEDNALHQAGHVERLLERGPRLSPSQAATCAVRAVISYLTEKQFYELWHEAEESGTTHPDLEYEALSDDVLYLFRMGHVYEDLLAEVLFETDQPYPEFGADDRLGREIRLVNDMWSGRVDVVTQEQSGATLWENKSTKTYALTNFDYPREADLLQLGIYYLLWRELKGQAPRAAFVAYWPNDCHPTRAIKRDLINCYPIRTHILQAEKLMQHVENVVSVHTLDDLPSPPHNPDSYPCSWRAGKCKCYELCHGAAADPWHEIPF